MDISQLRSMVGDLGAMSPAMRRELRVGFRRAGGRAAERAKANASWSRRIPGAITVRPLTGARSAGVFLRVNADKAPHARAYEGLSRRSARGSFRHPVFGRDVWVSQATRPYILPAVNETRADTEKAALDAVTAAARVGRFR